MIDFHTHIFPEKIADSTISHLSNVCHMDPFTNGKEEGMKFWTNTEKHRRNFLRCSGAENRT